MKKFFTVLLIAAAGTLYADISIGGLVDMVIVPYQLILNDDTARPGEPEQESIIMGAGAGRYASGQGPRARLDLRAYNDNFGMRTRIQARTDGISIEDYLQAWWKPLNWLRIDAGRFFDDRLRGKINDLDERMNAYNVRMYDADAIFSRFRTHRNGGQAGLMVSCFFDTHFLNDKDEELSFGALLYDLTPFSSVSPGAIFDGHTDYVSNNADVYNNIQAAAAWTVKDMLQLRVQYFGVKPQVDIKVVTDETAVLPWTYWVETFSINAPRIEAAFAYTAVPGLTLDIGGKIPLPFTDWTQNTTNIFEKEDDSLLDSLYKTYKSGFIWQAPYQASLGASYSYGNFAAGGRVDAKFGGSIKGRHTERYIAPELNMHIWPSYDLGFASAIFDFGFEYIGATYNQNKKVIGEGEPRALNGGYRLGAGLSLQKNFTSNCLVKGGFAYKFATEVNCVKEKAVFTIPLFLDFSL